MAVIQKIREKSWLLLVLIGLAMVLFVVDPSSLNPRSARNTKIAEVDGKTVEYEAYYAKLANIEEFNKIQRGVNTLDETVLGPLRHQALEELINEAIMQDELHKIGLAVHGDELFDMIQGRQIHPIINQLFANPETGVVNRAQLYNFLQSVAEDEQGSQQKTYWLYIENVIYKSRLQEKYNTLITKGLYATTLEAERKRLENNTTADILYAVKKYQSIADSTVSVSDSELRKYFNDHKEEYKAEEVRSLRYVTFNVMPSIEDYNEAEKWINNITDEFASIPVKEAPQYINFNSDDAYKATNYAFGELPGNLNEFAFSANEGDITGPIAEGDVFKLAKLIKRHHVADSVKARHIVFDVEQNTYQQVSALVDSLADVIRKGGNFNELASEYSQDRATALTGGDLGWMTENVMSQNYGTAFKDSCFYNPNGHVFTMFSQFGLQLVQVSNVSAKTKKVQVGILSHKVVAGTDTDQQYFSEASEFAGKNNSVESFNKAVKSGDFMAMPANNIKQTTPNIPGLEGSRQIVRWAYEAKEGEVSTVFQLSDSYVVAILDQVVDGEYKNFEDVEEAIKFEVIRNKKGEMLKEEFETVLATASSIDNAANSLGTTVQSAADIRFRANIVPGTGEEKKLVGVAMAADQSFVKKPIVGQNGVYIISVEQKESAPMGEFADFSFEKRSISSSYNARISYSINNVLKEVSDVKDYRTKYF